MCSVPRPLGTNAIGVFNFIKYNVAYWKKMSKISFMQLKHWHLKQIIIALAVILVILESKKKIYYGCFYNPLRMHC